MRVPTLFPSGLFLLVAGGMVLWLCPLPQSLLYPPQRSSQRILDRNGVLLYEVHAQGSETSNPIPLSHIPSQIIRALLTAEDRTFYQHGGISLLSIVRAAWQDLTAGRIVSGGSTLTQQLARSRLPSQGRGVLSKVAEAILALKLEQRLSKDEVLSSYLNSAYFGHQAYGLSDAAHTFFGKNVDELSLAQSAFLIALLQAPTNYDPFQDPKSAMLRRNRILEQMESIGYLSSEQKQSAEAEPLKLASGRIDIKAPHFVFSLLQERGEELADKRDVTTTLDAGLQAEVEMLAQRRLSDLQKNNVTSAAVVVLDAHSGDLLAELGSADFFDATHDGAVNSALAPRQPGSAIKPFTYALAFEHGATPATTVADVETQFSTKEGNPYVPRNYDYLEHGLVRYREALANSYNIAAVKVLQTVSVGRLLTFLRDAGLDTLTDTPDHYGLALTLGDAEVRLLDLARAYGIFARGGKSLDVRELATDPVTPGRQLLHPASAWLVANILSDNAARLPEFGGDSPLAFERTVAAKTGTTRNSRDNWTVGFTPDRIVGVWVGNADNSPMKDTSGVTGAGPLFHDVMEAATRSLPDAEFPRPQGIVERDVCRLSGLLPTTLCTDVLHEYFSEGTEPTEPDTMFQRVRIDERNGLLAGIGCDVSHVREDIVVSFPQEVQPWARDHGWHLPPSSYSPLCTQPNAAATGSILITSPKNGDSFQVDPLVPDTQERLTLTATAPSGMTTAEWYANGTYFCTAFSPDFRCEWPLKMGSWSFELRSGRVRSNVTISVVRH